MTDSGLGGIPLVAEVGAPDRRCGGVLVDVGVVEQAEPELHGEHAACRLVDARLGDAALRDEVEEDVDALLAAELVGPGLEDELHPSGGSRCSTPHARAGSTWSPTWLSLTSSQSVTTTPS